MADIYLNVLRDFLQNLIDYISEINEILHIHLLCIGEHIPSPGKTNQAIYNEGLSHCCGTLGILRKDQE
jgi:hypothetical protein